MITTDDGAKHFATIHRCEAERSIIVNTPYSVPYIFPLRSTQKFSVKFLKTREIICLQYPVYYRRIYFCRRQDECGNIHLCRKRIVHLTPLNICKSNSISELKSPVTSKNRLFIPHNCFFRPWLNNTCEILRLSLWDNLMTEFTKSNELSVVLCNIIISPVLFTLKIISLFIKSQFYYGRPLFCFFKLSRQNVFVLLDLKVKMKVNGFKSHGCLYYYYLLPLSKINNTTGSNDTHRTLGHNDSLPSCAFGGGHTLRAKYGSK
ncbi:hypothetical protein AGLY_010814 [Aphis glycines]|uniref:Uncharacterized protein n=1 Tax=Aphis glycines TaxID=307491 RepID=A0A6G0TF16_APHGL|nr:hypothetical protein AGLY_010814 [Aphis glycines]